MPAEDQLRFLKLDYASHKAALLQRVQSRWPLVWNDFLNGSFGRVLVDLIAWSTATLAYIVNRTASELFVPTMTLRESAIRLGALTGYKLRGPAPAIVACEAVIAAPVAYDVVISKGTIVRSTDKNNLTFEVLNDYTIVAGNLSPQTLVATFSAATTGLDAGDVQSNLYAVKGSAFLDVVDSAIDLNVYVEVGQTFQQTGLPGAPTYAILGVTAAPNALSNNRMLLDQPWAGTSGVISGVVLDARVAIVQGQTLTETTVTANVEQPGFVYQLGRQPVLDGSVSVTVGDAAWLPVASLSTAGSEDQVFEVRTLPSGVTVVLFGDDTFGQTVPVEALLEFDYRIGGGSTGNVDTGTINASVNGVVLAPNLPVNVSITNVLTQGIGGADAETLEQARVNIPASTRAGGQAVTIADYQTQAQQYSHPTFGRVALARAVTRAQNTLLEGNLVQIYAWANGANGALVALSAPLKNALKVYLQTLAIGTDYVIVADGTATPAPISFRYKVLPGYDVTAVGSLLMQQAASLVAGLVPGTPLPFSDLERALDSQPGVDSLDIATPGGGSLTSISNDEVYTPPDSTFTYATDLNSAGGLVYTGVVAHYPLQPWSFVVSTGGVDYTVLPDTEPGYAQIVGGTLAPYVFGTAAQRPAPTAGRVNSYYEATDAATLYQCIVSGAGYAWVTVPMGTAVRSRINLSNGMVTLASPTALSDFTIRYLTSQGYADIRMVDIYISYTALGGVGGDTVALQRSIREAIREVMNGMPAATPLFGVRTDGLTASLFNIGDIVAQVAGVAQVNRVALDTPGSTANRLDANAQELIQPSLNIVLNGIRG